MALFVMQDHLSNGDPCDQAHALCFDVGALDEQWSCKITVMLTHLMISNLPVKHMALFVMQGAFE